MKHRQIKNIYYTALVAVLFVVTGLDVFFVSSLPKKSKVPILSPITPIPSPEIISIPPIGSTKLKSYQNSKFGFDFKYPAMALFQETNNFLNYQNRWGIYIFRDQAEKKLADTCQECSAPSIRIFLNSQSTLGEFQKEIIVNGKKIKYFLEDGLYTVSNYQFEDGNSEIIVSAIGVNQHESNQLLLEILSSIKFSSNTTKNNFCGGIAAVKCPLGLKCQLDGSFPDAGGHCVGLVK